MTIEFQHDNGNNLFKCDICGKKAWRNDEWVSYGSIALSETCPQDIPLACSDKCCVEMKRRFKNKEMALPKLTNRGYYCDVVHQRVGY